jgi:hypothetical protein
MNGDDAWPKSVASDGTDAWGEAPSPASEPTAGPRYRVRSELARGGMGRVDIVRDEVLRRDVARKVATRGSDLRLEREAWLTARLDHPSIVPVFDAGRDKGRFFYTMRLVRGRPLSELLDTDLEGRLSALRYFVVAAEAVAYAHSVGIVHRDLKPSNIVVGAFGETQVVDWGVARAVGECAGAVHDLPASTLTVGAVGTLAYMAPEQARGDTISPAVDVWGLGAMLYEILAGQPPRKHEDATSLVAQARVGEVEPLSAVAPDAPPELAAIVIRALQPDPDDRYPDARMLAADVQAWLDGHRVRVYRYSNLELLRRLLRAWRVPLLITGIAAVLLASVALWAASTTRAARKVADAQLSSSLTTQAAARMRAGSLPEAAVLAARALQVHEDPRARGVLAAWHASETPRLASSQALPCPQARPFDEGVLCMLSDGLDVYLHDDLTTPEWSVRGLLELHGVDGFPLLVGHADQSTEIRDIASGARVDLPVRYVLHGDLREMVGELPHRDGKVLMRCPHGLRAVEAHVSREGRWAMQCGDHAVIVWDDGGEARELPLGSVVESFSGIAWMPDGERLLLTGWWGGVHLADTATGEVRQIASFGKRPVIDPVISEGGLIALVPERGGPAILDARGTVLARLPTAAHGKMRWEDATTLLTAGKRLERWSIPERMRGAAFQAGGGITALRWEPDGDRIAVTTGHHASIFDADRRLSKLADFDSVAKDVRWRGDELVVAVAGDPAAIVMSPETGAQHTMGTQNMGFRRVVPTR